MDSLQQVVEQLALLAAAGTNATSGTGATSATSPPSGPLELTTSAFKMLFSASALFDWSILLVIGSFFETVRRSLASLWYSLINSFFITAVFDGEDVSFQWIMHWLSMQPSWKGARNVQISTSDFNLHETEAVSNEDSGTHSRKVVYLPAVSESYTLWYKYRWMRVTRAIETHRSGWSTRETLTFKIMTRDHEILSGIIDDAKNGYFEAQKGNITVHSSDRFNGGGAAWRVLATRPKRPLSSIILDPGITEVVLEDVQDFLSSKQWYAERGIPFRRGYLLHGASGSGKTSLIHSIAGELDLDVFIVSLSRSGLDDTGLIELISALPERSIALMEDIDAAFHHGISRESPPIQIPNDSDEEDDMQQTRPPPPTGNRVSLSGLLNALDGIGAQEGRVLFATTNKYSSLDPALCRPGRMDLHIEFKLASRVQAEELFKRFYSPTSSDSGSARATEKKQATASEKRCENESIDGDVGEKDPRPKDLIDLSELSSPPSSPSLSEKTEDDDSAGPIFVGVSHHARAPTLSLDRVNALAAQFSHSIPERKLSMAALQGYLMMHKSNPFSAVTKIEAWVEKELTEKEDEVGV